MTRPRRAQGEGSVYQRADGRWVGQLDLGYRNGKRARPTFYANTERELLKELDKARRAAERGQDLMARPRKLGEWLAEWLEMKRTEGTRPLTLRSYRQLINSHVMPTLGATRLDRLAPIDVRRLITAKVDEGLSTKTVREIHGTLRNALADAERHDLVIRNVAKAVRPPAVKRKEIRVLSKEDAQRLIKAIAGQRLEAFWYVALTMGLRRGEILGLFWEDIDFSKSTLRVQRALIRADGALSLAEVKTLRSQRRLAIPGTTLDVLAQHRERQDKEREQLGDAWADDRLVFASTIGTPIEPRNVNRLWQKLRDEAGLKGVRIHDLRHACATFLLASGVSPRVVMEVLGHSQISLTMNTYTHVLEDSRRDAATSMDRLLFND